MRGRSRFGVCLLVAGALGTGIVLASRVWAATGRTALARVSAESGDRAAAAEARVRPQLERDLAAAGLAYGAPLFVRVFKREKALEVWLRGGDDRFALFRTYPVCTYSGSLGPKLREGDSQAPEGFYRVAMHQLNPRSQFHLSFNLGYPNAYDRAHGRTGSHLMVHGSCVSIGCYAMGDAAIEEIYSLASAALRAGQPAFDVHAFPFRLDDAAIGAQRASPWHAFWSELKPGYDAFERSRVPPRIRVAGRQYVVEES